MHTNQLIAPKDSARNVFPIYIEPHLLYVSYHTIKFMLRNPSVVFAEAGGAKAEE